MKVSGLGEHNTMHVIMVLMDSVIHSLVRDGLSAEPLTDGSRTQSSLVSVLNWTVERSGLMVR